MGGLERFEQLRAGAARPGRRCSSSPHTAAEYDGFAALPDSLIDRVGEHEAHPLASLMEVVGALVERHEEEHVPDLHKKV